jgi:alkylated DNA nucleotide flippase Atl1
MSEDPDVGGWTKPGGLWLLAEGLRNADIAALMRIGDPTVARHVGRVLAKLQAPNRTRAIAVALRSGLLSIGDSGRWDRR